MSKQPATLDQPSIRIVTDSTQPTPNLRNNAPQRANPSRTCPSSNITIRPVQTRRIRRISELIDPLSISDAEAVIQSPSGNLLSHKDFALRADRPLSMRERQEKIRKEMLWRKYHSAQKSSIPESPSNTQSAYSVSTGSEGDVFKGKREVKRSRWSRFWLPMICAR